MPGRPIASDTTPRSDFFALAGHPVRWSLLSELARSDRQVDELVAATGRPQPLVRAGQQAIEEFPPRNWALVQRP